MKELIDAYDIASLELKINYSKEKVKEATSFPNHFLRMVIADAINLAFERYEQEKRK